MFSPTRFTTSSAIGTDSSTSVPDHHAMRSELLREAALRKTQLLALRPAKANDHVATEYRASVRRIYNEIHAALDRIDAGTYGDCTSCGTRLPTQRLLDRPWAARCEACVARVL